MMKLWWCSAVFVVLATADPAAAQTTEAEPDSWLRVRQMVGVAGWPSGLISDSRVQLSRSLHRSDSILFQDTWAGLGGRARVTPAFADIGPRVTLAPIDIFDIELQAAFVGYWPTSSGLLPYDDITESTRDFDRGDRHRDDATRARYGWAVTASAAPTLKAKVGPIIAIDGWTFEYFHIETDGDSPYLYEAFHDRLLERRDLVVVHEAALLFEILDGKRSPHSLMVGALFKDSLVLGSADRSIKLGGVVLFKPTRSPAWPSFAGQVLAYVHDEDRVGRIPSMGLAAVWEWKLRKR